MKTVTYEMVCEEMLLTLYAEYLRDVRKESALAFEGLQLGFLASYRKGLANDGGHLPVVTEIVTVHMHNEEVRERFLTEAQALIEEIDLMGLPHEPTPRATATVDTPLATEKDDTNDQSSPFKKVNDWIIDKFGVTNDATEKKEAA